MDKHQIVCACDLHTSKGDKFVVWELTLAVPIWHCFPSALTAHAFPNQLAWAEI